MVTCSLEVRDLGRRFRVGAPRAAVCHHRGYRNLIRTLATPARIAPLLDRLRTRRPRKAPSGPELVHARAIRERTYYRMVAPPRTAGSAASSSI